MLVVPGLIDDLGSFLEVEADGLDLVLVAEILVGGETGAVSSGRGREVLGSGERGRRWEDADAACSGSEGEGSSLPLGSRRRRFSVDVSRWGSSGSGESRLADGEGLKG
jgi:hypothetical protein